jgi:hypothetical protein
MASSGLISDTSVPSTKLSEIDLGDRDLEGPNLLPQSREPAANRLNPSRTGLLVSALSDLTRDCDAMNAYLALRTVRTPLAAGEADRISHSMRPPSSPGQRLT